MFGRKISPLPGVFKHIYQNYLISLISNLFEIVFLQLFEFIISCLYFQLFFHSVQIVQIDCLLNSYKISHLALILYLLLAAYSCLLSVMLAATDPTNSKMLSCRHIALMGWDLHFLALKLIFRNGSVLTINALTL